MARIPIRELLENDKNKVLVLDGGQGTELENRGIDVSNRLWNTAPFLSEQFWSDGASRDRDIVKSVFRDFVDAGAEVLRTSTYQSSFRSITENTDIETLEEYNALMDRIIDFSRECIGEDRYLMGSVGPWGAYIAKEYDGDYGPDAATFDYYDFFKPMLESFNNNDNVDIIGMVTIPNVHELRAVLSFDETQLRKPFYISLSVHDNGTLRDGTTMEEVADIFRQLGPKINPHFMFLGVNCVDMNNSTKILGSIHDVLPDIPLIMYPNSGERFDTEAKKWMPKDPDTLSWDDAIRQYIELGARVVGGCCRTKPEDISAISAAVARYTPGE